MLTPRACLQRAKDLVQTGGVPELLHAALELRIGIEARLHEYRDAAEKHATLKRRGWQIAHLAKDLEKAFRTGEKVVSFAVHDLESDSLRRTFLYTPVRKQARNAAERLGDYLHFTERTRPHDPKWLAQLRSTLQTGIDGLAFATAGTLMAPPLRRRETAEVRIITEAIGSESRQSVLEDIGAIGENVLVHVSYLDSLPTIDHE